MKRGILILIAAISSYTITFSQDLIVTFAGDSINCKISKIKSEKVFFITRRDFEILNTSLELPKIKSLKYNYYEKSLIPVDYNSGIGDFKPYEFSIDGGLSFRIARLAEDIPGNLIDYYTKLKSGYNIGVSASYYLNETVGIGLKYQSFFTSNSIANTKFSDPFGRSHTGNLSDKINIWFCGPSVTYRYGKGVSTFYTNYYTGFVHYKDNAQMSDSYVITGNSAGFGVEGGYDLELTPGCLLGFKTSLLFGSIGKFKVYDVTGTQSIDLKEDNRESIMRIDLSIGLRFK